jgi:hypothetical protein
VELNLVLFADKRKKKFVGSLVKDRCRVCMHLNL